MVAPSQNYTLQDHLTVSSHAITNYSRHYTAGKDEHVG